MSFKRNIKFDVNDAKKADIYSMLLFALFRSKDIKSYGSLPEMMFILEKDSFLRLCEYFGGREIYIPSIDELKEYVEALLLFERIDIDDMDFDVAVSMIAPCTDMKSDFDNKSRVLKKYGELKEVLQTYEFTRRRI